MNCRHHPTCPGCPQAGAAYPLQLRRKGERLAHAFAQFPHLPAPEPVIGSEWTEGYRHRLKLPLAVSKDGVRIGLYDRNGRNILDTPDCPVLAPELRAALPPILGWLRGKSDVHSLDLRVSRATGALQAVFAAAGGELPGGPRGVRALMSQVPALKSVAVSRADPERRRVMGAAPRLVAGDAAIEEAIGATRYRLYPGAFFQVDPRQAERLHGLVKGLVGNARTVLDLYCGVGAYARMLAPGRQKVLAVEEVPQAAEAARAGAPPNVEVICGKVEEVTLEGRWDCAVINPARRGSDPAALARLAQIAARIVYVSCGPETLARDLDCLAAHGLRVVAARPIDLFPQTGEVETVVALERGPALKDWEIPGGRATGPWLGQPSGAVGKPTEVLALAIGNTGDRGTLPGARFTRLAVVATHSLIRIELQGNLVRALSALANRGHPLAGRDFKTKRFFAEKAGLVREFLHVSRAGKARAPLHGDLRLVLEALGADARVFRALEAS